MGAPSPSKPNEGPVLPVVTLVLSVVGLCFPPLLLITFALGGWILWRGKTDPALASRKQLAQMAMAVSATGVLILGGLVLPNIKKFKLRARQIECRATLTRLGELEKAYYARHSRYATSLAELDPAFVRGRQLIRLSADGPLWTEGALPAEATGAGFDASSPAATLASSAQVDAAVPRLIMNEVGLRGTCPACTVTLLCASELDGDPMPDVWTWSTIERLGTGGVKIPGGLAWNEVDDLTQ